MITMPPEWSPHAATWMGYPRAAYPGTGIHDDEARNAWSAVANAISEHELLHMLVHPEDQRHAEKTLAGAIARHEAIIDDAWLRDSGPTFVLDAQLLTAIDWTFNGWGDHTAFAWDCDDAVASQIADWSGARHIRSTLVNEGGGIHVNGQGQVLLTETVQRDPHRNPNWSREDIETEIHARLGTHEAIWLPRGLYRDYLDHGTRGHVDIVACFTPASSTVLLHQQLNSDHPDWPLFDELAVTLKDSGLDVLPVPAPTTLRDHRDWVDYSYINHYVLNGAVIMPSFNDPHDDRAREILTEVYPGRAIIPIDARVLFALGGGVHCITQQQPASESVII